LSFQTPTPFSNPATGIVIEAAANCRVDQTEEGPMLNLMSVGCTQSKRLFWRRPTPKQLERLVEIFGEDPRWFEDFYTKEEFDHELMH